MSGFLCLLFLLHDEIQRPECRHAHQKKWNKKLNLFSEIKLIFFFSKFFSEWFYLSVLIYAMDDRIILHWHRKACHLILLSTGTCWKAKSDRNGHHWVNSYLFILLGHTKSLYTNRFGNSIERPWLRGGFHASLEDGRVSAAAERSICFWWYRVREVHARVICCIFCLFF